MLILGGYKDPLSDRILPMFQASRTAYGLYGAESSVGYYLDPEAGHVYSRPVRVKMIEFFNRHLKGVDDPQAVAKADAEQWLIPWPSEELKVFPPGASKGKDIITLEREYLAQHRVRHDLPRDPAAVTTFQRDLRARLAALLGDVPAAREARVVADDGHTQPGSTRTVLLNTEAELNVPLLIYHPDVSQPAGLAIYLQMRGPTTTTRLAAANPPIRKLLAAGYIVAVPEIRATGGQIPAGMDSVLLYTMALDKHLFAGRVFDLQRTMDFLAADPAYHSLRLVLWGHGLREGILALYAAALDLRVDTVVSEGGLVSYQDIVDKDGTPDFDWYVPGILKRADVAQIAAVCAPRRVVISSPVCVTGRPASPEEIEKAYEWAAQVYRLMSASDRLLAGGVDPLAVLTSY
jgi:hypothetical protein